MYQDFFKNLKAKIVEYSPDQYSIILVFPIVLLIAGFFVWNIYLYTLGFTNDDILRSRFILTGLLFLFVSFFVFRLILKKVRVSIAIPLFFIWMVFYSVFLFPILPLFLGGGQPISLSLVATPENMKTLKSLSIQGGDGAPNQTENLCIAHEGSSGAVYVLRSDRVFLIDRSLFNGFGSLPGAKSYIIEPACIAYALSWSAQGLVSSLALFLKGIVLSVTVFSSIFLKLFGFIGAIKIN
ncbi:MAG: hypothetical protein WC835_02950 [Candidatus Paceibacterota bacterium]|jgi:hypothetical protein